jgi:hypothetical protein
VVLSSNLEYALHAVGALRDAPSNGGSSQDLARVLICGGYLTSRSLRGGPRTSVDHERLPVVMKQRLNPRFAVAVFLDGTQACYANLPVCAKAVFGTELRLCFRTTVKLEGERPPFASRQP